MQAIILAAGMGKRLKELTVNYTKCMVKVNGTTIIERMLGQLSKYDLSRIVIVAGYKAEHLIEHVSGINCEIPIEYVINDIYGKTNNIYSLYLARRYLLEDDTILLESDLVFEDAVLDVLVHNAYPNLALVDKYESWMDGSVVTLGADNRIRNFLTKQDFDYADIPNYYKTVNIYKFSKHFSRSHYVPFLEAYCKALGYSAYYEQVLKVIAMLDRPEIRVLPLNNMYWYEIDDIQDLDIAESIFATEKKLEKMEFRFGGYWRYPKLLDFCYLVNPYYPPKRMLDEIKASFERLICNYPSGIAVNSLLAAKYFGLFDEQIVVGNGASELIKCLATAFNGSMGVSAPTFEEYPNRKKTNIVKYTPAGSNFAYTADDLIAFFDKKEINWLLVINPDNPSGNYIDRAGLIRLLSWSKNKKIRLVVDESFVDFANLEDSLLHAELLSNNPHLVVIKSISKSFGVPGLRLGVLASGDKKLIARLKKDVAIWNINSFAEFFLQIFEKYKSDYLSAIKHFRKTRASFIDDIGKIGYLRPIPTKANFVMCEISPNLSSRALARVLLNDYRILIKDLSLKSSVHGQFVRFSVKLPEENKRLVNALSMIQPEQIRL